MDIKKYGRRAPVLSAFYFSGSRRYAAAGVGVFFLPVFQIKSA